MEKIHFQSLNQTVNGTLFTPKSKARVLGVIFFHGMTSSEKRYLDIAERVSEKGIACLTVNLRGHGDRSNKFDVGKVSEAVGDGIAAYDFFSKHDFIDDTRIGICGASFGGAVAALLSNQRKVKSLILRAPATYTYEMMDWTFKKIMSHEGSLFHEMKDVDKTPAVAALSNFDGSLLVVESENDTIIPKEVSEAFLSAAVKVKKKSKHVIRDATHNLADEIWREEFINLTVEWFSKTLI